jgi:hypothetical protein
MLYLTYLVVECDKIKEARDESTSWDSLIFHRYVIADISSKLRTVICLCHTRTYRHTYISTCYHLCTTTLIMLIDLLHILHDFKDERRRYTWNEPLGLDECLSTSLKNSPGDCVRYSGSNLLVSLWSISRRIERHDSHYQKQEESPPQA